MKFASKLYLILLAILIGLGLSTTILPSEMFFKDLCGKEAGLGIRIRCSEPTMLFNVISSIALFIAVVLFPLLIFFISRLVKRIRKHKRGFIGSIPFVYAGLISIHLQGLFTRRFTDDIDENYISNCTDYSTISVEEFFNCNFWPFLDVLSGAAEILIIVSFIGMLVLLPLLVIWFMRTAKARFSSKATSDKSDGSTGA